MPAYEQYMKGFACLIVVGRVIARKITQLRLREIVMLAVLVLGCLLFAIVRSVDPTTNACSIKLPSNDNAAKIYTDVLKWKEPVTGKDSKSDSTVTFECKNGFLSEDLPGQKQKFACTNGKYDGKYALPDLLCKSDYHKQSHVKKIQPDKLNSKVFNCVNPSWVLYEVSRDDKPLYRTCLDTNVMRTKFSFRLPSSEKPIIKHESREDVWGFEGYGKDAEERKRLSQGYVKKLQQSRITRLFPNKYSQEKKYPYYFNRGHLVAFADFNKPEDQKTTVEYLNAAPQWEVLNKHSWTLVERESRSMMQKNPQDWEVYTGTYGSIQANRPTGPLFLVGVFDNLGRFLRGQLPVPLLFWKVVYNTKTPADSRAFIGINDPEVKLPRDILPRHKLCTKPKNWEGKEFQGSEFLGYTYECPVTELLQKLKDDEKVVK